MVVFRSIGSVHQRLLLSVVIISGLVPLISPIAPLASATTPQELQQCFDKFNNKDIISSSLSVADQTLLSTCRASNDCKDAGEGSLIGSRRITCTNPANNQAYQDTTQKASTAETAPLIKLTCGGGGGGDTAISNYQTCAQKVTSAYDACSSSGGGVTGQIQVSASSTATCLAQKYPTYTVADLQGAIESGRSAKAGILNTAANGASSTSGNASAEQAPSNACGIPDITGPLAWVMCPITSGLATFAKFLANRVGDLLYVSPETAFNDSFHGAWTSFRNIGLALVVIAGLFMVISQALGLEFLDAYTIRKLMPRLAVVMIGMTLSWPLLVQLVVLFNDLGIWAHNLILTPFDAAKVGWNAFNISSPAGAMGSANQLVIASVIERGILGVGAAGLFIGAGLLGWSGILALIGTVVLALLIGLLVLASRQVILMAAILMAPLAIACYVLPGTQKVWAFWKNTVITTLAMFPIIMGFIAIGEALSRLIAETSPSGSPWQFFAILVFFAPYFMLPFAFKLAGGLMSTIFSLANDKSRGAFDRLRNFRKETADRRKNKWADGSLGKEGGFMQRTVGTAARMTTIKDQNYLTRRGRRAFKETSRKFMQDAAAERAEKEKGYAYGDTEEATVAQHAKSDNDFVETLTRTRDSKGNFFTREHAEKSLAKFKAASGGASIGSRAFRLSLYKGRMMDNAAFYKEVKDDDGNVIGYKTDWDELTKTTDELISSGAMDASHAGAILGANQMRGGISSLAFGDRVAISDIRAQNRANGIGGPDGELTAEQHAEIDAKSFGASRASGAMFGNYREARIASTIVPERIKAALRGEVLIDDDGKNVFMKDIRGADGTVQSVHLKGTELQAAIVKAVGRETATLAKLQDAQSGAAEKSAKEVTKVLQSTIDLGEYSDFIKDTFARHTQKKDEEGKDIAVKMDTSVEDILEFIRSGQASPELQSAFTTNHRELGLRQSQFAQAQAQLQAIQAGSNLINPPQPGAGGYK